MASSSTSTLVPLHQLTPEEVDETETEDPSTCPECEARVRELGIESVCSSCGLVLDEDPIDHGPEWGPYDADERERTGAPRNLTLHDRGLGSEIGGYYDLNHRQRRVHTWARMGDKATRNKIYGLGEIKRMADVLDLAQVVRETACQLFEEAKDDGLTNGRSLEGIATAALVAASRIHGSPVTFDDARRVSRLDDDAPDSAGVYRCYQRLNQALDVPIPLPDPARLVAGVCDEVGLGASVQSQAEALCREYVDETVGRGWKPGGVAAAAVYLACKRTVTQRTLADAADVTAPTLRKSMRVMEDGDG